MTVGKEGKNQAKVRLHFEIVYINTDSGAEKTIGFGAEWRLGY